MGLPGRTADQARAGARGGQSHGVYGYGVKDDASDLEQHVWAR